MYFLAAWQTISPVGTGAWETIDLTGAPFSVPTSASFALIRDHFPSAGTGYTPAFRRNGDTTSVISSKLSYRYERDVFVPLKDGKFDIYNESGHTYYLVGYFSGNDGVSLATAIETSLSSGWTTVNLSSYVPSNAKWIVGFTDVASNSNTRKYGSSALFSSLANGYLAVNYWLIPVGLDGKVDVYVGTTGKFYTVGYLTSGSHNSSPLTVDKFQNTADSTWQTRTTSTSNEIAVMMMGSTSYSSAKTTGWRGAGIVEDKKDYVCTSACGIVPFNSGGQFELYTNSYTDSIFYTIGWLTGGVAVSESNAVTDTLTQHFYTPLVTEIDNPHLTDRVNVTYSKVIAETAATASTSVPDKDPLPVAETANTASTSIGTLINVRSASSTAAIASDIIGEILYLGRPGDDLDVTFSATGTGYTGTLGESGTRVNIRVTSAANIGLDGYLGSTGTASLVVSAAQATGMHGSIGTSGTVSLGFGSTSTALFGSITPTATANIYVKRVPLTRNPTGFIGDTGSRAYIKISTTGDGLTNAVGSTGDAVISVTLVPCTINITGGVTGTWTAFNANLPLMAVTESDEQYIGYCVANEVLYGIKANGIYRVDGLNDNGTAIPAIISKRGMDFGSPYQKNISDLYMRMSANGSFNIYSQSENSSGNVTMTNSQNTMQGSKVNMPRGVIGRELGVTIHNTDGSYFEIQEMEMVSQMASKRRGRQT